MSRNLALLLMLASLTLNSAWEEHPESQKALKVTIRSPPTMPVLSGTLTIPCHISKQWPLEETSVGRQAVLATPRVKWSFISSGKEMEILVARGHKVKINEAYRYRASMPNYSTSADDVTLVLRELRSNDSGVYRCHVQHGIEDDLDMLEVKVKGVVFLYREGTARYAYTFSMAQEACAKIRAHIATADQLLAAYQSGYEQCDAGWIADQTVRYPIQTPREGCYGDMDGYPGVRNYGVLEPDDLYDVYCYVEELNGEVFLDSRPDKFTLEEAKTYCRSLGATVATTGQLYAAWNDGLDSCSPGWLSDGSVRYPIVTPRERCGGNSPGVKTIFQFRNQTGFPDSKAKYDVYCFREKGPYRTQGSEDDRTAPVGAIITVTESFKELKFSEVKGENEAQGSVDTIPLFTTGETGLGDDQTATPSANTSIAVEKDASPPSLESAVSHKELSQSDLEEHVNSEEEDSYQDFREEDLPMEFTTEPSLGQALEDKLGSFPENQSVSSLQEMNGRILEGSVEPPTEFTTGDSILDVDFVNVGAENDYPYNNLTDSIHLHKPNDPKKPNPTQYSEKEEDHSLKSYSEQSIVNSSVSNSSQFETLVDPTQPSHDLDGVVEPISINITNLDNETQVSESVRYIDDNHMQFPVTTEIPLTHTIPVHKSTSEGENFEASGYEDQSVLTSGRPKPIGSSLEELATGDGSGWTSAQFPLPSAPTDLYKYAVTLDTTTPTESLFNSSRSSLEEGSGDVSGSTWLAPTMESLVDINITKTTMLPLFHNTEEATGYLEMTQFSDIPNSTTFNGRNPFDLEAEQENSTAQVSHLKSPDASLVDISTLKDVGVEQPYTHEENTFSTVEMSTMENVEDSNSGIGTSVSSIYTEIPSHALTTPPTDIQLDYNKDRLEKTSQLNTSSTEPPPPMPTERAILGASVNLSDACFPNPCENGGTCMEEDHGDVTCLCLPGYFGKLCDINTEKCLDDWDTFQGYCYKHFHTRKSWEEAETHCRDYGGHLASIMTPEEQDFINNQYREYQWTGLNDRTIEGDFQWSDGNPLLFESWNNGQPDSYFLSGENCVIMVWHDGGRWSDVPCNYHLPYTCKMGLVSCGSPPEVANATTYGKPKMRYQISSVVGYRCDDGFLQRNSPIIKCQTDGMWEEPQINCIPTSQ
ncbi:brevican core protein isoform 1-T2 [Discoglossus pictus]